MELGGIGIASSKQKITATWINYFLFNMQQTYQVCDKLDLSVTIAQLEVGEFIQFFTLPFC
jgi:hypothetical protein